MPSRRGSEGRGGAPAASGPLDELAFVGAVARKDLLQELRSRAVTVATLFFSGGPLMLLAFSVGSSDALLLQLGPGALWVALAFAGVSSAAQSYQADLQEGAFEQLLLYPVPRAAIFIGKLLANWLYLLLLGLVLLPVGAVLFDLDLGRGPLLLVATVALGTLGFAVIASFYAALTASLQARESLLPVLMFPVVVPILLASVRASAAIVQSGDASLAADWLQLLAGFDLVYLVVTTAIYHFVVEE
jgi:heme exporter protein B